MNFLGSNLNQNCCGCNNGCQNTLPTYQQCNQVVQTCNVEEVPHFINYHTHVVNNCIKRHVNVPTYSTSGENVMINEYVQGTPMYQQPMMMNNQMMYQQPYMYPYGQYQGNVGVEGFQQEYPNILNQNPYRF